MCIRQLWPWLLLVNKEIPSTVDSTSGYCLLFLSYLIRTLKTWNALLFCVCVNIEMEVIKQHLWVQLTLLSSQNTVDVSCKMEYS